MCGLVCPSSTSELEGKGYCVKGGWREGEERVKERVRTNPKPRVGHLATIRARHLHAYMSQDMFPALAIAPVLPLAPRPSLLCEVRPYHLVLFLK
jgi:hypothetical protein